MNILEKIFIVLWRIWFVIWMFLTVLILLPFLFVIISRRKWFPVYFKTARIWAKLLLFIMGFKPEIESEHSLDLRQSYIFCPNHTSMIDIMLLLSITENPFVFVGKKELSKYPLFGYIYKRTSILVDRNNSKSKAEVYNAAEKCIQDNLSICIFPEGKVPDDEGIVLDEFQNGAFRLAIENKIPIVPITFFDCKKRYPYTFLNGGPGTLRIKIHSSITTDNTSLKDRNQLKSEVYELINESLLNDPSYMKTTISKRKFSV